MKEGEEGREKGEGEWREGGSEGCIYKGYRNGGR